MHRPAKLFCSILLCSWLILILPFIHFQLAFFWLWPIVARYSHVKTCEPNLDSIVCTHTYTQKKKPFMHTDYIYLFIYHVCMHLMKCMCAFVYRLYCKKRWHLWTYLKIKVNIYLKKNPTSAKTRLVPIHTVEIYIKYLFSEVNVFLKKITNPKPYSSCQPQSDGPFLFGPINSISKI